MPAKWQYMFPNVSEYTVVTKNTIFTDLLKKQNYLFKRKYSDYKNRLPILWANIDPS